MEEEESREAAAAVAELVACLCRFIADGNATQEQVAAFPSAVNAFVQLEALRLG